MRVRLRLILNRREQREGRVKLRLILNRRKQREGRGKLQFQKSLFPLFPPV